MCLQSVAPHHPHVTGSGEQRGHKMQDMPDLSTGHIRRLFAGCAVVCSALVLIVGCSANQETEPAPTSKPSSEPESSAEPPPTFAPDGTANQNEDYFSYVLRQAIRSGAQVTGEEMVNALSAGGFDRNAMQVSFDESQTGLRADNIFVSVRMSEQCLLGQIVTADKSVVVDVQPAVGPEKTVCLIGQTRPIDW